MNRPISATNRKGRWERLAWLALCMPWIVCLGAAPPGAAPRFTLATYNVERYPAEAAADDSRKSEESKARVREMIAACQADVLALQEVCGTNALLELRRDLKAGGCDYPHWELITGHDTNVQVAVLSKFPITARRPQTRASFLLHGRRFQVARGFLEVDIRVNPQYAFTLLVAHLKSRRAAPEADESELREQEAIKLRGRIDAILAADPDANLAVVGDFNDVHSSKAVRTVIGQNKNRLFDTRPAEENGDDFKSKMQRQFHRNVTWTQFYAKEDVYSRIDYIFLSRGMAREFKAEASHVLAMPNWGMASDHRPVVTGFQAQEK